MTTLKELHEQMWKESKHADEQVKTFIVIPTLDAIEYVDKAFNQGKSLAIAECIKEIDEQMKSYTCIVNGKEIIDSKNDDDTEWDSYVALMKLKERLYAMKYELELQAQMEKQ